MKVDFDYVLKTLKGEPIVLDGVESSLSEVVCSAMINSIPDDKDMSSADKVKMYRMAQKAVKGGEQDLSLDDAKFIKDRIGKLFGPLIVGQVYDLLDPPSEG